MLDTRGAYFTSLDRTARQTASIEAMHLHVGANKVSVDVSTALAQHYEGQEIHGYWTGGLLKAGARWDWFSDVDPNVAIDPSARLVHGMRKGMAVRAIAGHRPHRDADDIESPIDMAAPLGDASRMPFDLDLLHTDTIFGAEYEYRIELIGCHAPFVHIRAAFLHDDARDRDGEMDEWTSTIQGSATVGMFVAADHAVMLQYAGLVQRLGERRYDNDQRWRIAYSWQATTRFNLGLNLDYATRFDGIFGGLNLAFDICLDGTPCER